MRRLPRVHARGLAIAVGSRVPSIDVHQAAWPPTTFNIAERCAGKKTIIVGMPGAFTPV